MIEEELFHRALEQPTLAEQLVFLDQVCADQPELRQRVERLLRSHRYEDSFLHAPVTTDEMLAEETGTVIGPYKLLEQIGEGGMGAVFLAEQTRPVRRKVALKVIKPGLDTRQVIARFEAERQALALMDHPHIAKVHDGGTTDTSRPYFVMELVQGIPITDYCDQNRLTTRQRLELFIPVCQAVQHAYQKGVIHRDLKPSNVLVMVIDGAAVPKVIDFGVAKATGGALTERTLFTGFQQLVGTPLYMSPEQASLSGMDVDTRSDVYSLGVLLYELLIGTTPFDRETLKQAGYDEMRRIIREEEPPKPSTRIHTLEQGVLSTVCERRGAEPRRLSQQVRGELDWIVMKALEKDSNRRYETATGLARDIERHLHDEPVQACPPSALYRFGKFARRHKRGLVSVSVLVLAGLVALGSLAVSNARISEEAKEKTIALKAAKASEQEAQQQTAVAKRERDTARRNLYVAHMNLAQAHWENANVSQVEKLLDLYRRVEHGQEDLRGWEWYYQERLCQTYLQNLRGHQSWVLSAVFSPDGRRLITGSNDQMVKVWDVATGRELRSFQEDTRWVRRVVLSPDGMRMAACTGARPTACTGDSTMLRLCDVASGREVWALHKRQCIYPECVALSLDGTRLAFGDVDGTANVWDLASAKKLCILGGWRHRSPRFTGMAFSPDGKRLATINRDQAVKMWDIDTGLELRTFQAAGRVHGDSLGVAFSPDGTRLSSGGGDESVKVWDLASGQEFRTFRGHRGTVRCIAFSPDGTKLASGGFDQAVKVWDLASGQEFRTFRGHNDCVTTVAFSPDGTKLASGGYDTVMLWEVGNHQEFRTLDRKLNPVNNVVFSPDGTRLASHNWRSVIISDVASGKVLCSLPCGVNTVAFSPDGTCLVTGDTRDSSIRLWDVASGKELRTFQGPKRVGSEEQINTLAFSPDGTLLASGSHHQAVKLWDVASGKELRTLQGDAMVWSVAFSPDGTRLASTDGRMVKLWDVASGKELGTLRGHKDNVLAVAFSPDGMCLASGSIDRTVIVWDVNSAKELRRLQGHRGLVRCVAFSPLGTRLASCSDDYTAKVWDVASGQELRTLRHENWVDTVAFNPVGMRLATCSRSTVRLWDAAPLTAEKRVEEEARGRLEFLFSRPLTRAEVVTRLRSDTTISEAVRRQALNRVDHYAQIAPVR
jgi:WD40 repeat protein/serine/threonine protein kinase